MADTSPYEQFIRASGKALREADVSAKTREEWDARRKVLRERMAQAMGPEPTKPCELEPRLLGTLERDGYRIDKLIYQTRPDVWVTGSLYVPKVEPGVKLPAVLVVHGHWAFARRDPVVQARCLGLVKLGFLVLAVDAFGAGERFTAPARGTYHGALYGSTLWPTGHNLLGFQAYENRRAIDYLLTRKDVNGKFGITGASGGGNQSMNAGAMDDRLAAVVPVCSVGNYQAYLQTACCVCEVLPNALTFTEEGDVLGLVAPRGLLVMNATRDGVQFSPAEAEKSVARAKEIFALHGKPTNVKHLVFESVHDYNQPMREAMYGWMTLLLKGQGTGEPIPEPAHVLDKPEDLACFPTITDRPKGFLTPPLFAGLVGRELVAKADKFAPDHPEMWEASANNLRADLKAVLGLASDWKGVRLTIAGVGSKNGAVTNESFVVEVERGSGVVGLKAKDGAAKAKPVPIVEVGIPGDRLDGRRLPFVGMGYETYRVQPRGTGKNQPKSGAIAGAPDHTPAEHGIWIGRPLLGQWTTDVRATLATANAGKPCMLVGTGSAALVALTSGGLTPKLVDATILVEPMVSFVTDAPYAAGTHMGLLAPGILKVGDVAHLAGLIAPRRLIIAGGISPQGKKLTQKELEEAFRFTIGVYKAMRAADELTIVADPDWAKIEI